MSEKTIEILEKMESTLRNRNSYLLGGIPNLRNRRNRYINMHIAIYNLIDEFGSEFINLLPDFEENLVFKEILKMKITENY